MKKVKNQFGAKLDLSRRAYDGKYVVWELKARPELFYEDEEDAFLYKRNKEYIYVDVWFPIHLTSSREEAQDFMMNLLNLWKKDPKIKKQFMLLKPNQKL